MREINTRDLDNWITGHFGEDQLRDEREARVTCHSCGELWEQQECTTREGKVICPECLEWSPAIFLDAGDL